jgi:hypothetical protein
LKDKFDADQRKKLYSEYYNLPDQQLNFTEQLVSTSTLEYLDSVRLINTLSLHNAEAMPHMFYLLVETLRKRNYNEALLWIACISHNLNDSASPHYTPSIYTFDLMRRNFDLTTPAGKKVVDYDNPGLYIDPAFNRTEGIRLLKKMKEQYKFESIGSDPEKVSIYLGKLPLYLRNASFKHTEYLVNNLQRNMFTDKPQIYNGNLAVAKMGIIGMTATANVLNTAWDIVSKRTRFSSDDIDMTAVEAGIDTLMKARKLSQMPLFQNVLPDKAGNIGVLAEPYYRFEGASLGYASRILAASIMCTLKKSNESYRAVNLVGALEKGLPAPAEMPILIIPACDMSSAYRWIKKRSITNLIKKYTAGGGKVMWISSSRGLHLGELSFSMKESKEKEDFSTEALTDSEVLAVAELGMKGKEEEIKGLKVNSLVFKTVPSDNMEWLKINSPLYVTEADTIKPLLFYKANDKTQTVAAYEKHKTEEGKAQYICISSLFFFPNIYSSDYASAKESRLDPQPEALLNSCLKMLK